MNYTGTNILHEHYNNNKPDRNLTLLELTDKNKHAMSVLMHKMIIQITIIIMKMV